MLENIKSLKSSFSNNFLRIYLQQNILSFLILFLLLQSNSYVIDKLLLISIVFSKLQSLLNTFLRTLQLLANISKFLITTLKISLSQIKLLNIRNLKNPSKNIIIFSYEVFIKSDLTGIQTKNRPIILLSNLSRIESISHKHFQNRHRFLINTFEYFLSLQKHLDFLFSYKFIDILRHYVISFILNIL